MQKFLTTSRPLVTKANHEHTFSDVHFRLKRTLWVNRLWKIMAFFENNILPISLLSNIEKVYEKLMYNLLVSVLSTHNQIYSRQFGFRKSYITDNRYWLNKKRESLDNEVCMWCVCRSAEVDLYLLIVLIPH